MGELLDFLSFLCDCGSFAQRDARWNGVKWAFLIVFLGLSALIVATALGSK